MAIRERSIVALLTLIALVGAFADGRIEFQSIIPLLLLVSVVPAFARAEAGA